MNKFFLHIRRDQVNLLIYGPDQPYFKQKQKSNSAKFSLSRFFQFIIFCFLKKNET